MRSYRAWDVNGSGRRISASSVPPVKKYIGVSLAAGIAIVVLLIAWRGVAEIKAILAAGGWALSWLGAYYLLPIFLATCSWRWLFSSSSAPRFVHLARAAWVGLSVNWLLPVAQVGGEIVKARLIVQSGTPIEAAGASVVVDKTIQAGTQLAYCLFGLAALAMFTNKQGFFLPTFGVVTLFALGIFGFYQVQRAGMFAFLAKMARRLREGFNSQALTIGAEELDRSIRNIYQRGKRLSVAIGWRLGFRIAMAGEIWIALALMGYPVSFLEAVIIESLAHSIRSAAFAVPGGVGVQEGGFMLVGVALGISPDVSLALSLARRFRELLVGLPGLLAWHFQEGRSLIKYRSAGGAEE